MSKSGGHFQGRNICSGVRGTFSRKNTCGATLGGTITTAHKTSRSKSPLGNTFLFFQQFIQHFTCLCTRCVLLRLEGTVLHTVHNAVCLHFTNRFRCIVTNCRRIGERCACSTVQRNARILCGAHDNHRHIFPCDVGIRTKSAAGAVHNTTGCRCAHYIIEPVALHHIVKSFSQILRVSHCFQGQTRRFLYH